jgi:hypothetical protein
VKRAFLIGAGIGVLMALVLLVLALWADERNTRFYQSTEARWWHG